MFKIMNSVKKILNIFKFLFISYLLFILNGCFFAFLYIKTTPLAIKAPVPFGSLAVLLTILEFFIYYKFIKRQKQGK